ncbi:MAG TPA: 16S rRNA (uracil(1498)-N(3))-methyltransferase [Burkholderiaceae bacterium]|nr:16S rRNA (uracil(1498)-N(3))-methyltransferase [Burkholderiaceae bacterium]
MAVRVLIGGGAGEFAGAAVPAAGEAVELDERRSHHLVRVLRLGAGDAVEAFDGRGKAFAATVEAADARRCRLRLGPRLEHQVESPLSITLGQCLSTADKMDWTIEKAVELGVAAIVPLASARSQLRLDADRTARKLGHWRNIVESACTQSGRSLLPALHAPCRLTDFVAGPWPKPAPRRLILDPRAPRRLSQAGIDARSPLVLLVGPESGFADEELQAAQIDGFELVSIGRRTLRTETAGLAAIAALQALAGDF